MMRNYVFMDVFNPEKNLIKEFDHWVILVREGQVTLGDCLVILKREIQSFGEMTRSESAELGEVLQWYEKRCRDLYGALKFNYITAMMRDNFVHFHAFPRYSTVVNRYGIDWVDEKWPRVIQFGPSQCDSAVCLEIAADMKDE